LAHSSVQGAVESIHASSGQKVEFTERVNLQTPVDLNSISPNCR